jgi:NTP pyrophosphatase (non-canonical NTP hydrolase)
MNLSEFQARSKDTDRTVAESSKLVTPLGLIGEVGTLAAVYKKYLRDGKAYVGFVDHLREELGDILWYVSSVANSCGVKLSAPAAGPSQGLASAVPVEALIQLEQLTSALFKSQTSGDSGDRSDTASSLNAIVTLVSQLGASCGLSLEALLESNIQKTSRRWGPRSERERKERAPCYDLRFFQEERLPRHVEVSFVERTVRSRPTAYMKINGVVVGDALTDNAQEPDGYRFHDAFHWTNVAVLGWSPVIRALLRSKRKSDSVVDEVQDGARAVIIEECIAFQVFSYARQNAFLAGLDRVDHDLLKLIKNLTRGLEVDECAEWEWEAAILKGFEIFRALRDNSGGTLTIDAEARNVSFRAN